MAIMSFSSRIPKLFMISILFTLSFSACLLRGISQSEKSFIDKFPSVPMNVELELKIIQAISGDMKEIPLVVINNSKHTIMIPNEGGRRIFYHDVELGWKEVANKMIVIGDPALVDAKNGEFSMNYYDVSVRPDLDEIKNVKSIRVVILGYKMDNDSPSDEQIGAYIDISLDDAREYLE